MAGDVDGRMKATSNGVKSAVKMSAIDAIRSHRPSSRERRGSITRGDLAPDRAWSCWSARSAVLRLDILPPRTTVRPAAFQRSAGSVEPLRPSGSTPNCTARVVAFTASSLAPACFGPGSGFSGVGSIVSRRR